ncbi:MAG TPA: SGNH/GDSL hydrolase family protein [Methylovirgula sp.]|nr:SGNH/GDSL hydrolase family protein [Methylovirgula sp.]
MSSRVAALFLSLISFSAGLLAVWLIASWLAPWDYYVISTPGYRAPDPILGWRPAHPGIYHERRFDPHSNATIYDADYTIDDALQRKTISCEKCGTIAFFGDSLTFGTGLEDADTLPQQVANRLPQYRIVNLGLPGSGAQQFLRELETGIFDKAIGSTPDLFVYLTGTWMVARSACKESWVGPAPRYELENGSVVYKGICADKNVLPQWMRKTPIYHAFIEPIVRRIDRRDIDLDVAILLKAAEIAKSKYGVPTLFLHIDEDAVTEQIVSRLGEAGQRTLDLAIRRDGLVISGDGHPTALANRLRADMISHYLQSSQFALH